MALHPAACMQQIVDFGFSLGIQQLAASSHFISCICMRRRWLETSAGEDKTEIWHQMAAAKAAPFQIDSVLPSCLQQPAHAQTPFHNSWKECK